MEPPKGNWCFTHSTNIPCQHCLRPRQDARIRESLNGKQSIASSSKGGNSDEPLIKERRAKRPLPKEFLEEDEITPVKVGESSTKKPLPEITPFNAALTAKIPEADLLPPPKDFAAVKVVYISKDIGFGLVAARDFAAGEFIFHERPLMEAQFNGHSEYGHVDHLIESQYQAYRDVLDSSTDMVKCLIAAFPQFAARMGLHVQLPADDLLTVMNCGIASNVIHGRLGESSVTFENFQEIWKKLKPQGASQAELRETCHDFFKNYAFQSRNSVQPGGIIDASVTVQGYIYLLASLINHRCSPKDPMRRKLSKLLARLTKKTPDQNTAGTDTAAASNGAAPPIAGAASESGPNCTWQISPGGLARFIHERAIAVRAKRNIQKGEELTWDYGRKISFKCLCRTCKT